MQLRISSLIEYTQLPLETTPNEQMGNTQTTHPINADPLKDKFSIWEKYIGHSTSSQDTEDKGSFSTSTSRKDKFEVCYKNDVLIMPIKM